MHVQFMLCPLCFLDSFVLFRLLFGSKIIVSHLLTHTHTHTESFFHRRHQKKTAILVFPDSFTRFCSLCFRCVSKRICKQFGSTELMYTHRANIFGSLFSFFFCFHSSSSLRCSLRFYVHTVK